MSAPDAIFPALIRAKRRHRMGIVCDALFLAALVTCGMITLLAAMGSYNIIGLAWMLSIMLITTAVYVMTRSRMSLAHVAGRLDDANQTHDLLATAWALRDQNDVWANQIHRMAEAQIATLKYPSRSGRYGPRQHVAAWMLLACIMIAIPLLSPDKPTQFARTDAPGGLANQKTDDPHLAEAIRPHATGETDIKLPDTIDPAQSVQGSTRLPNDPSTQSPGDASGGGKADSNQIQPVEISANPENIPASGQTDQVFSGSGKGGEPVSVAGGHGKTVQTMEKNAIPPWESEHWSTQQQAARAALQSGKIPSSQRDLVRAYFDR